MALSQIHILNNHIHYPLGVGATARCKRVKGTLKGGEKILVQVEKLDAEKGLLDVSLVSQKKKSGSAQINHE